MKPPESSEVSHILVFIDMKFGPYDPSDSLPTLLPLHIQQGNLVSKFIFLCKKMSWMSWCNFGLCELLHICLKQFIFLCNKMSWRNFGFCELLHTCTYLCICWFQCIMYICIDTIAHIFMVPKLN
jgi:hypothetical protein